MDNLYYSVLNIYDVYHSGGLWEEGKGTGWGLHGPWVRGKEKD